MKLQQGKFILDIMKSLRGWLVTGTGSRGKWLQHQACQFKDHLDDTLSHMV